MSTYRVHQGDNLSSIARQQRTSVSALMRANPQLHSANRIAAGARLNVPGSRDEFVRAAPSPSLSGPSRSAAAAAPAGDRRAGASSAFNVARQYVGWNAAQLKRSNTPVGRSMQDWVPNNVNCANFVSGALVASGQLPQSRANASVMGLKANLDRDPHFKRVSLQDARPGDVVSMRTRHGHHVVMFAGWQNGRPMFLGSNNTNSDGSQRIGYKHMNYPIMSIHQYRG